MKENNKVSEKQPVKEWLQQPASFSESMGLAVLCAAPFFVVINT